MYQVYETLLSTGSYGGASVRQYLERLLGSLRRTFSVTITDALHADIEDHQLQVKALTPLGMIVNELLTNTAKYAFPVGCDGRPDEISLTLRREGALLRLELRDNGVGLPRGFCPENSGGFGMMLVRLLAEQLQGSFRIGPCTDTSSSSSTGRGSGTCAVVDIPDWWIAG